MELKLHFVPKENFNKRTYRAACGQSWVKFTWKLDMVTCERCKKSGAFKGAFKKETIDQAPVKGVCN